MARLRRVLRGLTMGIRTFILGGAGAAVLTAVSVPPSVALTNVAAWTEVVGAHDSAHWIRSLIPHPSGPVRGHDPALHETPVSNDEGFNSVERPHFQNYEANDAVSGALANGETWLSVAQQAAENMWARSIAAVLVVALAIAFILGAPRRRETSEASPS